MGYRFYCYSNGPVGYWYLEGQNSYNHYVYNDANQIIGYDVNQSNTYPNMYEGVGGAGKWSANMGRGCYNFYPQDRYLLNMAYLRLKNLTVGYTLPVDITKKAFIQRARIYFSAENLAFLYNGAGKYGLDPELSLLLQQLHRVAMPDTPTSVVQLLCLRHSLSAFRLLSNQLIIRNNEKTFII